MLRAWQNSPWRARASAARGSVDAGALTHVLPRVPGARQPGEKVPPGARQPGERAAGARQPGGVQRGTNVWGAEWMLGEDCVDGGVDASMPLSDEEAVDIGETYGAGWMWRREYDMGPLRMLSYSIGVNQEMVKPRSWQKHGTKLGKIAEQVRTCGQA